MKITCGEVEVIQHGTVLTFPGVPLTLDFAIPGVTGNVKFEFIFEDAEGDESKIDRQIVDDKMIVKCINFKSPFGTTNTEPIPVLGSPTGSLLLSFSAARIGTAEHKLLTYTFFFRKKV